MQYVWSDGQGGDLVIEGSTYEFIVIDVDMDLDGTKDDDYTWPEVTEETTPGALIPLGEMVQLGEFNVAPEWVGYPANVVTPIDDAHPVFVWAASGGSKIRVYDNEDKIGGPISFPIVFTTRDSMESATYWVEGYEVSDSVRDIKLMMAYGGFKDEIEMTVFDFELQKCSSSFMPKGGDEDNSVQITAEIEPDDLTGTMKFTLFDVSSEPGFCLNKPALIPGSGEDSSTWKDLQFKDPQTGFTVSGVNKDVATTSSEVYTKTVEVNCYDYGAYGDIKAEIQLNGTWYTAHVEGGAEESVRIPQDSIEDNTKYISVAWAHHGDYDDDDDTSADNNHDGDGLTRYEEYRGVDYDDDDISDRLSPAEKDLFVQGRDFGGFASFDYGAAFTNADIAVYSFVGTVGTDDRNIDVLVVTAYTESGDSNIEQLEVWGGVRFWNWSTQGWSGVGTSSQYGSDTRVFRKAVNNRFNQRPYFDNNTWTAAGVWGGARNYVLDPIVPERVEDIDDDGILDDNEKDGDTSAPHDDGDNEFDGDYPVKSGSGWEFNHHLSPHDIDNDGDIELSLAASVSSITYEYSKDQVVKHVITHEMGHAVGISGPFGGHCNTDTCVMYQFPIDYNRDGHLCDDCRAQIYIHNN
jgi:hypothetical protein